MLEDCPHASIIDTLHTGGTLVLDALPATSFDGRSDPDVLTHQDHHIWQQKGHSSARWLVDKNQTTRPPMMPPGASASSSAPERAVQALCSTRPTSSSLLHCWPVSEACCLKLQVPHTRLHSQTHSTMVSSATPVTHSLDAVTQQTHEAWIASRTAVIHTAMSG